MFEEIDDDVRNSSDENTEHKIAYDPTRIRIHVGEVDGDGVRNGAR